MTKNSKHDELFSQNKISHNNFPDELTTNYLQKNPSQKYARVSRKTKGEGFAQKLTYLLP